MQLKDIKEEKASKGAWAQGSDLPYCLHRCSGMLDSWYHNNLKSKCFVTLDPVLSKTGYVNSSTCPSRILPVAWQDGSDGKGTTTSSQPELPGKWLSPAHESLRSQRFSVPSQTTFEAFLVR